MLIDPLDVPFYEMSCAVFKSLDFFCWVVFSLLICRSPSNILDALCQLHVFANVFAHSTACFFDSSGFMGQRPAHPYSSEAAL